MKRFESPWKGSAWLAAILLAVLAPQVHAAGDPVETYDVQTYDEAFQLPIPGLEGLSALGNLGAAFGDFGDFGDLHELADLDDETFDLADGGRTIVIGGGGGNMVRVGGRDRDGAAVAENILDAADDLELTDTQKTKLRDIRRKAPSALMPKRQAVVEARMELGDLMDEKAADPTALRRAHERLLEARKQLASAQFDLRMQAREVLTPEQLDKWNDARHEFRHRIRGPRMKMRNFNWDDADRDVIIEKF